MLVSHRKTCALSNKALTELSRRYNMEAMGSTVTNGLQISTYCALRKPVGLQISYASLPKVRKRIE